MKITDVNLVSFVIYKVVVLYLYKMNCIGGKDNGDQKGENI